MIQKNIKSLVVIFSLIASIGLIPENLIAQKVTKLFEKGQYEKAEQYCLKQTGEKQNLCFTELAEAYFKEKKYDKASEFYAKTNKSKEGYLKIADACFSVQNLEKSALFYEKADDYEGLERIGDAYIDQKACDKAVEYYEKAYSDNNEKLTECYNKTADAYLKNYNFEDAEIYYKKANNKIYTEKFGNVYLEQKKYDKAKEYFEKAFSEDTAKLKESYIKIADAYFDIRRFNKASHYYFKADYRAGYEKIGNYYFEDEDYETAAYYYKFAFYKQPKKLDESYMKIADALYNIKKYEEAAEFYRRANLKNEEEKCKLHFTFSDKRDGKTYKKIKIGEQVWMVDNLAYKASSGCWPYSNKEVNVRKLGYLYNWETAKNVCPDGWHLPSKEEFVTLLDNYGGGDKYNKSNYRSLVKDKKGIRVLLGGKRNYKGDYEDVNDLGYYWTSTWYDYYEDTNVAFGLQIHRSIENAGIARNTDTKYGFSVRCIKD